MEKPSSMIPHNAHEITKQADMRRLDASKLRNENNAYAFWKNRQ